MRRFRGFHTCLMFALVAGCGGSDAQRPTGTQSPAGAPMPTAGAARQLDPSALVPGQHAYRSAATPREFLLYVPQAYGVDPQARWPLVVFLHGVGSIGSNVNALRAYELPRLLETQTGFPALVLSPQLAGGPGHEYWPQDAPAASLLRLVDELQATLPVDPDRIYLTGVSLGGNGTWEIGLRHRERFAALVPVMGFYGYPDLYSVPNDICELRTRPVWAFHGARDPFVPLDAQARLVTALQACGGNVRFTVYEDGRHDIDDEAYGSVELWTWLLGKRR
jgi:predicted peptidase